jgi:hypothetical protein
MKRYIWAALCSALVAGCGGGGGSSPPPPPLTITAGNQDAIAHAAASAVASVAGAGGGVTASDQAGPTSLTGLSRQAALRLGELRKRAASAGARPLAIPPDVINCPSGGTTTISFADNNNSGTLDIGEGITFTFANCKETANDNLNGSLGITIDSVNMTPAGLLSFTGTMTVTQLVATEGTRSASLHGAVAMTYAEQSTTQTNIQLVVGTVGLTSSVSIAAQTETITYEEAFSFAQTSMTDGAGTSLSTSSLASGGFQSNLIGGRVILEAPQQLVQSASASYPGSGIVRVVGTGSALRLTVLDTTTVRQELDTNGDGSYDASKDVPWTTLMPL